jgi:hypothetical protein
MFFKNFIKTYSELDLSFKNVNFLQTQKIDDFFHKDLEKKLFTFLPFLILTQFDFVNIEE